MYGAKNVRSVPAIVARASARLTMRKKRNAPTIITYHFKFQYQAKACSRSRMKNIQNWGRKIVVQCRIGTLTRRVVAPSPILGLVVGNGGSCAACERIQGVCTIHSSERTSFAV